MRIVKMLTLNIDPVEQKKPFEGGGDLFYCGICESYTPNFTASSVKNRDRRCRDCFQQKRFERMQKVGHLQRLKMKLYQNLIYQKKSGHAKNVTINTVSQILDYHGIKEPSYSLVKTVKPVYDPVNKRWLATPVFYDLTRKDEI